MMGWLSGWVWLLLAMIPAMPAPLPDAVPGACRNTHFAASPDGQQIVYQATDTTGSRLYVLHLESGQSAFLAEGAYPQWSPDGRWIAYQHQNAVYRIRSDGTHQQRLATGQQPRWFALVDLPFRAGAMLIIGGLLIAMGRRRRWFVGISLWGLCLMLLVGLLSLARQQPAAMPWLYFEGRDHQSIYRIAPDGSQPERVFQHPVALDGWHLDHNRLTIAHPDGIFTLNSQQSVIKRVDAIDPLPFFDRLGWLSEDVLIFSAHNKIQRRENRQIDLLTEGSQPGWSSDGRWLTFADGSSLYLMRLSSRETHRLHDLDGYTRANLWLSNDEWIVFEQLYKTDLQSVPMTENKTRFDYFYWSEIYRVRPDGTELMPLVTSQTDHCRTESAYLERE